MMQTYDFMITSFLIMFVLLVLYFHQRHLPIERNRAFLNLFVINVLTMLVNTLVIYPSVHPKIFAHFMMYILVMIYQILFLDRAYQFYSFTAAFAPVNRKRQRIMQAALVLGFLISVAFVPLDDLIEKTFHLATFHIWQISVGCLYNLFFSLSSLFLIRKCQGLESLQVLSLSAANVLIAFGAILRHFVASIPFTDLIYILAIVILYFGVMNPDLYISKTLDCFNLKGMQTYMHEQYRKRQRLNVMIIAINNWHGMLALYSRDYTTKLLKSLSHELNDHFKKEVVGYINDGRFCLLTTGDFDFDQATRDLMERFKEPFGTDTEIYLTCRIVILKKDVTITNEREMHDLLDQMTHEARTSGRSTVVEVSDEDVAKYHHHLQVEDATNKAIEYDTIQVYYQPIYSVSKKRVNGAEALSRLIDPELGFISPEEFIAASERSGTINRLGFQIIEKVCRFIHDHDLKALGLDYINVNLSPLQCLNVHFPDQFFEILKRYDVDSSWIRLEITESSICNEDKLIKMMNQMVKKGILFNLDDYGTGYSNINRVAHYPFSTIKIDLTLTWSYFKGENHFLPHVIEGIQGTNNAVTVEGVETKEMADALIAMQVTSLQGYYFSKPIPADAFIQYLQSRS